MSRAQEIINKAKSQPKSKEELQERYKLLCTQRDSADQYFKNQYGNDTLEKQAKAKARITEIIRELQELEQQLFPWLKECESTITDNRKELYVYFPPETWKNIVERVEIIQADGWKLKSILPIDGKEYGEFIRGETDVSKADPAKDT